MTEISEVDTFQDVTFVFHLGRVWAECVLPIGFSICWSWLCTQLSSFLLVFPSLYIPQISDFSDLSFNDS